jgi:hypothetical protein
MFDVLNKKVIKKVEKMVGRGTTFGSQLMKAGKTLLGKAFAGVFASDEIPHLKGIQRYAILNLDKSWQPGSHWIGLAREGKNDYIIYDSFGRKSSKIVPEVFNKTKGYVIDVDPDPEQKVNEDNCGARSLAWLHIYDKYGPGVALLI